MQFLPAPGSNSHFDAPGVPAKKGTFFFSPFAPRKTGLALRLSEKKNVPFFVSPFSLPPALQIKMRIAERLGSRGGSARAEAPKAFSPVSRSGYVPTGKNSIIRCEGLA